MRTWIPCLPVRGFTGWAPAIDRVKLDNRIRALTAKFEFLQAKPDKAVPAEILDQVRGIGPLDRIKARFLFTLRQ